MRDIFTYPDNSATYYIDPRYIGDNTAGFQKRINDMRNNAIGGAYNFVHQPDASLEAIMAGLGRYYNMYNNIDTNNTTVYNFTKRPLVEIVTREKVINVTAVTTVNNRLEFITESNHGLTDGDHFYVRYVNISTGGNQQTITHWPNEYPDAGSNQEYLIAGPNSSGTTLEVTGMDYVVNTGNWAGQMFGDSLYVMRDSGGAVLYSSSAWSWDTDNVIKKNASFQGTVTGTVESSNPMYLLESAGPVHSYELYTDQAKTTRATLDEDYITTVVIPYDGTIGHESLSSVDLSGLSQAIKDEIAAADYKFCRVYYQNQVGGTYTAGDCTNVIGGSRNYDQRYQYGYSTITEKLDVRCGAGVIYNADFNFNGTASDTIEIVIEIIRPARLSDTDFYMYYYNGTETVDATPVNQGILLENWINNSVPTAYVYHEVWSSASDILLYGNWNWANLDVNGNPVYQAKFTDFILFPGEQFFVNYSTTIDDSIQPVDIDLIVDGSGYLTDWTINDTGVIDTGGQSLRWSWLVGRYADEYVPSPPTNLQLAQAEDYFDTNDEWNTYTGFAQKYWPAIPPKSARIDMKTPTLTTFSQSGMKYARHAGYTRWGMDVEYPPLTKDQLAELQAAALLARGGAVTFYFRIDPLSTGAAFGFLRNFKSNVVPRIKTYDSVNQVLLVEGFQSDEAEVIVEGQLMNSSGLERNGAVQLALNSTDANVFGEAKIKLGFNDYQYPPAVGNSVWLTPNTIIVSLSEDNFQYVERGDGLYNVSVKFDLDTWK